MVFKYQSLIKEPSSLEKCLITGLGQREHKMDLEPLAVLEFHKGRGKERKRGGKRTFPKESEPTMKEFIISRSEMEKLRMKRLRRHDD